MRYQRFVMTVLVSALAFGLMAAPSYAASGPAVGNKCVRASNAARPFNARAGMIAAANDYFKNSPVPVVSAADLYASVQANDGHYQVVDVRSAEHFALGHIQGAINIPFRTIADDASLVQLDSSKTIVTVCYTGETASMTNMVWNMLGYDTTTLMFGMSGWVADKAIVGADIPTGIAAGYPTVKKAVRTHRTYCAPKLSATYADVAAAVKGQTKAYFAKGLAPIMTAAEVNKVVVTKDRGYQIISVRQKADYAVGHIKGARNIVWTDIANRTRTLDPKKTTIVYCYTGNTGAQAAMFLNLMGYRTYNMMSGMAGWNNDAAVGGFVGYNPATVPNFAVVK